jgi:hypothetical protein
LDTSELSHSSSDERRAREITNAAYTLLPQPLRLAVAQSIDRWRDFAPTQVKEDFALIGELGIPPQEYYQDPLPDARHTGKG